MLCAVSVWVVGESISGANCRPVCADEGSLSGIAVQAEVGESGENRVWDG